MSKAPPPPFPPPGFSPSSAAAAEEAPILELGAEDLQEVSQPSIKTQKTSAPPSLDGARFGRFELLLEMAKGGMATLFLARIRGPQNFEKLVVIKKIHDHLTEEQEFVDMFLDEARISAMIHHPNVAQIYDMGNISNSYYIAMEYVHGQDLAQVLRAVIRSHNRTYNWAYACRMVADAAAGLHAAHELKTSAGDLLGLVHRDVSPQNILVSYDGHTKVVDFGIAWAAQKISVTDVGTLKGKAPYMSPEQTRGQQLDRRSDIFALGTLLFESVLLKRLFREENEAATLLRVSAADVPKPRNIKPDLHPELENIVMKALAKDPETRYQTAADLQEALEKLLVSKGEVVGPSQVSKLMGELFHDRRRIRDQQIKEVLKRPSTKVGQAIGLSTTTVTKLDGPLEAEAPPRRWLWPVLIGGGIAVAAVVALVIFLMMNQKEKRTTKIVDKSPPAMMAAPMPATMTTPMVVVTSMMAVQPEKVLVEVVVKPNTAKATILFRGKKYRQNNLALLVERRQTEEVIQIQAPKYKPKMVNLIVNEKVKIPVELIPKPRRWVPMRRYRAMGSMDDLLSLPND